MNRCNLPWLRELGVNLARSRTMLAGWAYVVFGAVYDYLPAFKALLGPHFAWVFMATGGLMMVLRVITRKPVIPAKKEGGP
jgi:hypothetical protein